MHKSIRVMREPVENRINLGDWFKKFSDRNDMYKDVIIYNRVKVTSAGLWQTFSKTVWLTAKSLYCQRPSLASTTQATILPTGLGVGSRKAISIKHAVYIQHCTN